MLIKNEDFMNQLKEHSITCFKNRVILDVETGKQRIKKQSFFGLFDNDPYYSIMNRIKIRSDYFSSIYDCLVGVLDKPLEEEEFNRKHGVKNDHNILNLTRPLSLKISQTDKGHRHNKFLYNAMNLIYHQNHYKSMRFDNTFIYNILDSVVDNYTEILIGSEKMKSKHYSFDFPEEKFDVKYFAINEHVKDAIYIVDKTPVDLIKDMIKDPLVYKFYKTIIKPKLIKPNFILLSNYLYFNDKDKINPLFKNNEFNLDYEGYETEFFFTEVEDLEFYNNIRLSDRKSTMEEHDKMFVAFLYKTLLCAFPENKQDLIFKTILSFFISLGLMEECFYFLKNESLEDYINKSEDYILGVLKNPKNDIFVYKRIYLFMNHFKSGIFTMMRGVKKIDKSLFNSISKYYDSDYITTDDIDYVNSIIPVRIDSIDKDKNRINLCCSWGIFNSDSHNKSNFKYNTGVFEKALNKTTHCVNDIFYKTDNKYISYFTMLGLGLNFFHIDSMDAYFDEKSQEFCERVLGFNTLERKNKFQERPRSRILDLDYNKFLLTEEWIEAYNEMYDESLTIKEVYGNEECYKIKDVKRKITISEGYLFKILSIGFTIDDFLPIVEFVDEDENTKEPTSFDCEIQKAELIAFYQKSFCIFHKKPDIEKEK